MTYGAREIVNRARSLVGVKFRRQGRDPLIGLDCVGVVLWAFGIPADSVRRDYRLRDTDPGQVEAAMRRWFSRIDLRRSCAGDVMLFAISAGRSHLAISCGDSFVHANALLRRVVETPLAGGWPLAGTFRSQSTAKPD